MTSPLLQAVLQVEMKVLVEREVEVEVEVEVEERLDEPEGFLWLQSWFEVAPHCSAFAWHSRTE